MTTPKAEPAPAHLTEAPTEAHRQEAEEIVRAGFDYGNTSERIALALARTEREAIERASAACAGHIGIYHTSGPPPYEVCRGGVLETSFESMPEAEAFLEGWHGAKKAVAKAILALLPAAHTGAK